jgi:hypothetical protein
MSGCTPNQRGDDGRLLWWIEARNPIGEGGQHVKITLSITLLNMS